MPITYTRLDSCSLNCYKSHKGAVCNEKREQNQKEKAQEEKLKRPVLPVKANATQSAKPEGLIHPLQPLPAIQVPLPESNHLRVPQSDLDYLIDHRNDIDRLLADDTELKAKLHAIWKMTSPEEAEKAMKELLTLGTEKERKILASLAAFTPPKS